MTNKSDQPPFVPEVGVPYPAVLLEEAGSPAIAFSVTGLPRGSVPAEKQWFGIFRDEAERSYWLSCFLADRDKGPEYEGLVPVLARAIRMRSGDFYFLPDEGDGDDDEGRDA